MAREGLAEMAAPALHHETQGIHKPGDLDTHSGNVHSLSPGPCCLKTRNTLRTAEIFLTETEELEFLDWENCTKWCAEAETNRCQKEERIPIGIW